ncbi:MAG TPA: hypothetical protein VGM19_02350 [Armatimonadota bacterium]|jgi:hypothetical protein
MNLRLTLLLAGLLLVGAGTLSPAATPEERTVTLNWRSNLGDHAWVERGYLALRHSFALNGNALWLSARQASAAEYHHAVFTGGLGPDAFAGSPKRLEFFLEVTKPGKYYVWYRLRVKQAGIIRHLEGVDSSAGAPISWVDLEVKEANAWTWLRREGQVEFKAGLHELQMDSWTDGVDVSRIVLVSDEKWSPPAGEALPEPAAAIPWTEGTGYSGEVQPSTVLKWGRLTYQSDRLAKLMLSYSTDAGKTWTPVPEGGDLSAIPVKSEGTDRLRFRASLTQPEGAFVYIGPLTLTYTGDRDDLFSLADATGRYFFARQTGALCGIQNVVTKTWLTPERKPQPIFAVRLRPVAGAPEKDWETVTSLDAKCLSATPSGTSAKFVYEIARPGGVATVALRAAFTGPGELTWTAWVKNNMGDFDVVDLTYPLAYGVKASASAADDTLLINGNYLVKTPANFGRFLYYWPTGTAPLMDIFNDREGLAMVAHDDTLRSTGLSARGLDREAVELSLIKVVRVRGGDAFAGPPHLLRVHQGDWHQTGLVEWEWLAQHRPSATPPLWLAECDGWVPTGWPAGWWTNMGVFADKMQAENGFGWVQYWNFQVPGTTWTIPHPNPINGSEAELRWGIDQQHRRGMRTTFYIQGLLYDPQGDGASPDDPIGSLHRRDLWPGWELPGAGFASRFARRNADGEMHEWSPTEREMCYASTGFAEYKRQWGVDRFLKRLGADGLYWDSLSYGATCWATDHGHGDDPGQWGSGAQANHALIVQQARALNPTSVTAAEGPPLGSLGGVVDVHLDNAPNLEVVRFLFPKMLVYLGSADGADPTRRKAFLYGCRFDGLGADADQQALLRIRRLTKQYLYPATPMDTMGLGIGYPPGDPPPPSGTGVSPVSGSAGVSPPLGGTGVSPVQARWFLCDPTRTKGAVVTILNEEKRGGVKLSLPTDQTGPIRTAWVVDSNGADGPLAGESVDGGKAYEFYVPPAAASTVLLLGPGAEPRVTVTNEPLIAQGGEAQVTVKVESLTGERVRGTIGGIITPIMQPVEVWTKATFDCTGAGERGQTFTLIARADGPRLGLFDRFLSVAVNGGPLIYKLATFYVEPPVRVTPVWAKPDLLRITVENRSLAQQGGAFSFKPTGGVRFELATPASWNYSLAPGAKTVLSVPLVGGYACQTPWAVEGSLQVGGMAAARRPGRSRGACRSAGWRRHSAWGTPSGPAGRLIPSTRPSGRRFSTARWSCTTGGRSCRIGGGGPMGTAPRSSWGPGNTG